MSGRFSPVPCFSLRPGRSWSFGRIWSRLSSQPLSCRRIPWLESHAPGARWAAAQRREQWWESSVRELRGACAVGTEVSGAVGMDWLTPGSDKQPLDTSEKESANVDPLLLFVF